MVQILKTSQISSYSMNFPDLSGQLLVVLKVKQGEAAFSLYIWNKPEDFRLDNADYF